MNYDKYSYQSITFELRTGRNVCQLLCLHRYPSQNKSDFETFWKI